MTNPTTKAEVRNQKFQKIIQEYHALLSLAQDELGVVENDIKKLREYQASLSAFVNGAARAEKPDQPAAPPKEKFPSQSALSRPVVTRKSRIEWRDFLIGELSRKQGGMSSSELAEIFKRRYKVRMPKARLLARIRSAIIDLSRKGIVKTNRVAGRRAVTYSLKK